MKRIRKLQKKLRSMQLDGFLVISEPNISYLTGFTGDSSRLLITKEDCVFLTDGRYLEQSAVEIHSEIEVFKWINDNRYGVETYQKFIHEFQIKSLGFESNIMSHAIHEKFINGIQDLKMIPTENLIEDLRMIKDTIEIQNIRKACKISEHALKLTVPYIKPGISEQELTARLEFNMKMEGADGISFETIVLSGERTSHLHGHPGKRKLELGDFILFDFGALYKDYHSDISRTFVLGKANQKQKEIFNAIQAAQRQAINCLKPGINGSAPDHVVRKVLDGKYLDHYYPGLGHGIGLEIHEPPFIKNTSEFVFKAGMTITIEPGIYIPGWGGTRIEDTILITEEGFEILTDFPRDLLEL